jgi:hypothetical protein
VYEGESSSIKGENEGQVKLSIGETLEDLSLNGFIGSLIY